HLAHDTAVTLVHHTGTGPKQKVLAQFLCVGGGVRRDAEGKRAKREVELKAQNKYCFRESESVTAKQTYQLRVLLTGMVGAIVLCGSFVLID
ncbi:hypothetical protein, partial [Lacticaseibacillus mingshuiensis]|uniref:hypothetical protein n=1 Tax=Lacticaseibacillus mingshuiensis TaxID=2799574 RepID=UPI001945B8D9